MKHLKFVILPFLAAGVWSGCGGGPPIHEAERIAANNGAEAFRENDFLVTDLFSASLTEGKHVLLICRASPR